MAGDPTEVARVPAVELRCPNCGAPWTLRGFATTRSLACESCGAVIDRSGERWQLVDRVQGAYEARPVFPLGRRGALHGVQWEIIGWCERCVRAYGQRFAWEEHLLYNPFEGFRYLLHQDGHFVLATPLPGVASVGGNSATYEGRRFRHFSKGKAQVEEVLGEFPWEMRRGDVAVADDYVDPPSLLSREETETEVTWSRGEYLAREVVLEAFGAPGRPLHSPRGVHPCQPDPHAALTRWMGKVTVAALLAWALLSFLYFVACDGRTVWSGRVPPTGVAAQVELREGTTLEVDASAPLNNQWLYLDVALVGPLGESEVARWVGIEVERWSGPDWSEGSNGRTALLGGMPAGQYVLQVTPDPASTFKGDASLTAREDVPVYRYLCCSFLSLVLIPLVVVARSLSFERRRWAESDHV